MKNRIIEIIANQACEKPENISLSQKLRDDLYLDSLDIMELTICIEKELKLDTSIRDEVIYSWVTVEDVVNNVLLIENEK